MFSQLPRHQLPWRSGARGPLALTATQGDAHPPCLGPGRGLSGDGLGGGRAQGGPLGSTAFFSVRFSPHSVLERETVRGPDRGGCVGRPGLRPPHLKPRAVASLSPGGRRGSVQTWGAEMAWGPPVAPGGRVGKRPEGCFLAQRLPSRPAPWSPHQLGRRRPPPWARVTS